jgi:hypothetical protein
MKSQGHENKVFVTLLCTYSTHVHPLEIFVYICSFIHFSVLFMYNARTEPYTWTYISSAKFIYEKLIETKKELN